MNTAILVILTLALVLYHASDWILNWLRRNPQGQASTSTTVLSRPILNREIQNGVWTWLTAEIVYLKARIDTVRREHEEATPEVTERLFWQITIGLMIALGILEWATINFMPNKIEIVGMLFNPQLVVHTTLLIYIACGFRSVEIDKVAGLDFFGTPVFQFGHGLKWYPFLLFNFTKESAFLVQAEFPADANHIHWDGDKTELPKGKARPIYLLTGENPKGTLPSDKQINLGIALIVKIQATSARFFDLVRNTPPIDAENGTEILNTIVGNKSVTPRLLEIIRQLRDTSARNVAEIIGQLSYNEITLHRGLVDEWLEERLRFEVVTRGIELREGGLTILNPGHEYNQDIAKRTTAMADRDATITRAQGNAEETRLMGEAKATARLADFKAEAEGKKAIMEALGVDGHTVLGSEAVEKLAEGGNTFVGDIGVLGGLAVGAAKAIQHTKGTTT